MLLELGSCVQKIYLAQKHRPAAVSLKSEAIHDCLPIFTALYPLLVLFPEVGDRLSAAPASDRYYHRTAGVPDYFIKLSKLF